jgi:hypothetical protein
MYAGPDIIFRNVTPNSAGMPEGGHTLSRFMQIMKTGIDFDHIHPTCTAVQPATINSPSVTVAELVAIPCIDNTTSTPPAGTLTSYSTPAGRTPSRNPTPLTKIPAFICPLDRFGYAESRAASPNGSGYAAFTSV